MPVEALGIIKDAAKQGESRALSSMRNKVGLSQSGRYLMAIVNIGTLLQVRYNNGTDWVNEHLFKIATLIEGEGDNACKDCAI